MKQNEVKADLPSKDADSRKSDVQTSDVATTTGVVVVEPATLAQVGGMFNDFTTP